jgi:arylsulfatase A-like enzyme
MHYAAAWLKKQDQSGQPSFLFARTTTNRQPWETPTSFKAPRFDVAADGEYARYLQTYSYTDACVGLLMKLLQEQGLSEKTIVFVFGDHGMPMGEHLDNFSVSNYLYEENVRVPLLILAPGRIEHPTVVSDIGSQIDLLPTVMDMLQLTGDNHSLGTSLLRHVPNRTVVFNNPFAMQYVGMRQGEWKYVYTARSRTGSLFNLKNDPNELTNVAAQHLDLVSQYHAHVMGLTQSTTRHFWQESFAPGAVKDKTPVVTNNNSNPKKPTPPTDHTTSTQPVATTPVGTAQPVTLAN